MKPIKMAGGCSPRLAVLRRDWVSSSRVENQQKLDSNASCTGRMERGEGEFRGQSGHVKERTTSSCRKLQGGDQKEAILTDSKHFCYYSNSN